MTSDANATLDFFSHKPVVVWTTPDGVVHTTKLSRGSPRLSPSCDLPPNIGATNPLEADNDPHIMAHRTRVENRHRSCCEPVSRADREHAMDPYQEPIANTHRTRVSKRSRTCIENRHRKRQKGEQNDELCGDKMTQAIRLDPTSAPGTPQNRPPRVIEERPCRRETTRPGSTEKRTRARPPSSASPPSRQVLDAARRRGKIRVKPRA
jgi:hypothetical protein